MSNKFFKTYDPRLDTLDNFVLPSEWWSRPYEYHFAAQFLNDDDVILDAGCGIKHPFKDYAAARVKKCIAIDNDKNIEIHRILQKNLELKCMNMTELANNFNKDYFDKVFCISVLEHIQNNNDRIEIFKNFKKVLKPYGKIIITIDYPLMDINDLIKVVDESELKFEGKMEYSLNGDVIKSNLYNLYCASAVIVKG